MVAECSCWRRKGQTMAKQEGIWANSAVRNGDNGKRGRRNVGGA